MTQNSNSQVSIPALDDALSQGGTTTTSRILQTINGNQVQISEQLAKYYARNKTFLARLFPTGLDRVLSDGQLNLAKSQVDLDLRVYALAATMKYAVCREVAESWVKSMRVETKGAFFTFVTGKMEELRETIEQRRITFGDHVKKRYATLETLGEIPVFQEEYRESVENEIKAELGMLDDLLEKFRATMQEGLEKFEKPALPGE